METFVLTQRIAGAVGDAVFRKNHRQLVVRHRLRTVLCAVHDRDRRAPVALARNAPVAQAPGGFLFAEVLCNQPVSNFVYCFALRQIVQAGAGVEYHDLFGRLATVPIFPLLCVEVKRLIGCAGMTRFPLLRVNESVFKHLLDRKVVFVRKREIPLIMRRHTHHRAVAVADQHVIADPHFDLVARQRMRDEQSCRNAFFFLRGKLKLSGTARFQRLNP